MLQEFVNRLVQLGRESSAATVLDDTGDPRLKLLNVGGEIKELTVLPELRDHQVRSLEDLVKAAVSENATQPVVYHSEDGVRLLLDDSDRRDVVTFRLTTSEPFNALFKLASGGENGVTLFQPRSLWRLLRTTFADCSIDSALLRNLQKLKWRSGQETRQEFSQGRESIGKDIEAELQSDVAFPESITPMVRVYNELGEDEEWPVRCLFEVDALEQRILFGPFAGELDRASQLHQGSIRQRLEQSLEGVPIYYGTP